MSELHLRRPKPDDAAGITRLIEACGPLDVNSTYAYLLLCHHFAGTCVVAELNGELAGFLSAYVPPAQDDTLFVWQVAVASTARGRGLASSLIENVLARDECRSVRFVEATVSPSNRASQAFLQSLARRHRTECRVSDGFPQSLFGEGAEHEAEELYRIGPLTPGRAEVRPAPEGERYDT